MLDSPMIDVAFGLILFFLVMSLAVTAAQEWVSSILKLKGNNLKEGIENLVGNDISKQIYNHPLIKTMGTKTFIHNLLSPIFKLKFLNKKGQKRETSPRPSYLKSEYFAKTLIDLIDTKREVFKDEKTEIQELTNKISNPQIQKILRALNIKAKDKIEDVEEKISQWFDAGMARVSGLYKRKIQFFSFLIASVLVIVLNANAITIAIELWENDHLQSQVNTFINNSSNLNMNELQDKINETKIDFPLGWKEKDNTLSFWKTIKKRAMNLSWSDIIGWFITISAVSLGAPFWFNLLGKVAHIRKPKIPSSEKEKTQAN